MANYVGEITSPKPAGEVFAYLADFSNVAEWDPSVRSAEALTAGDPEVGSRFAVTVGFYGRSIDLEYEITELEPERRIVLQAEDGRTRSRDVITVTPADDGCSVIYDATVELKGVARFLDKGLQLAFNGLGDNAIEGLDAQIG